jgi:hypothetical protein
MRQACTAAGIDPAHQIDRSVIGIPESAFRLGRSDV